MAKLKLGTIPDDKPVKLTVELPAAIHRDLVAYGNALGRETGQGAGAERHHVDSAADLPETLVIARKHLEIGQQVMRPQHRLGPPRVGIARDEGVRVVARRPGQLLELDPPILDAGRLGDRFDLVEQRLGRGQLA